ncbi:MAG: YqgE/AlgH family protein [Deltaproteobacteria bacterium]|nr:YqgE/AlgH family protein [Deltaproteobacteria bacterium]
MAVFLACLAFAYGISRPAQLPAYMGASNAPVADRPFKGAIQPAKGKLLIATPRLAGSIFSKTIILLIEHGPKGAQGVIINRPTHLLLSSVLPDLKTPERANEHVYYGGPVSTNQLTFALIKAASPPENSKHVFGNVYSMPNIDDLKRIVQGKTGEPFRVFAGYSGWASGQLEAEIAMGSWRVAEPDEEMIFSTGGILKTDYKTIQGDSWPRRPL